MESLKDKKADCRTGDLTPCFMEKDVKEAVLKFQDWLQEIDYEISLEKVYDKHIEIFGTFN